ncbi:MAG: hypothetical protein L0221_04215, partial [Chloroflexi bacterium]|nr:hypothetical protein [Chloroflexota bacterium]
MALELELAPTTLDGLCGFLGTSRTPPPDFVVLSIAPLLDLPVGDGAQFLRDFVAAAKTTLSTHVLAFAASTALPDSDVSCYRGLPTTTSEQICRLDLVLFEQSQAEGVGVIDADRTLADLGAAAHVEGPLTYSASAREALCAETVRVLLDYGFLDDRPLLRQV